MFGNMLKDLREGAVLPELDEALKQLVADVRATGKSGSLTLTLSAAFAGIVVAAIALPALMSTYGSAIGLEGL